MVINTEDTKYTIHIEPEPEPHIFVQKLHINHSRSPLMSTSSGKASIFLSNFGTHCYIKDSAYICYRHAFTYKHIVYSLQSGCRSSIALLINKALCARMHFSATAWAPTFIKHIKFDSSFSTHSLWFPKIFFFQRYLSCLHHCTHLASLGDLYPWFTH